MTEPTDDRPLIDRLTAGDDVVSSREVRMIRARRRAVLLIGVMVAILLGVTFVIWLASNGLGAGGVNLLRLFAVPLLVGLLGGFVLVLIGTPIVVYQLSSALDEPVDLRVVLAVCSILLTPVFGLAVLITLSQRIDEHLRGAGLPTPLLGMGHADARLKSPQSNRDATA